MSNEQGLNNLPPEDAAAPGTSAAEGAAAPGGTERYGALKGYFYTPKRGDMWGAFCFLFNGTTGAAMDNVFWVTRVLAGSAIDISVGWRDLNKKIPQMGVYEKALGDKLSSNMLDIFSKSERIELSQAENPSEHMAALSAEIRNDFERATHYLLEFNLQLEPLSADDLVKAGVIQQGEKAAAAPAPSAPQSEEKSFHGTLITCLPVIDPVSGVPVSELAPGDLVEVRMQGGVGAGDLIQKYLTSQDQDAFFPVESVEKKDASKTYVFLTISEEIRGLITVTKDLRLRVTRASGRGKKVTVNMDNVIFFGIIGAAVAAIVFIVKHFFF